MTLSPFLGATPKQGKKPIRFPDRKFYAEFFEKKKIKNLISPRSSQDPGNSIVHQQPFSFVSGFGDFEPLLTAGRLRKKILGEL